MNSFFRDLFDSAFNDLDFDFYPVMRPFGTLAADLSETDSAYELVVDLGGAAKDAVKVELLKSVVRVTVEDKKDAQKAEDNRKFLFRELKTRKLCRDFYFPSTVDMDRAEATYVDGKLKVTVQKFAPKKASTRVLEVR